MKKLFINPEENRPRAVWRIIITTILIISLMSIWAVFFRGLFAVTLGLAIVVLSVLYIAAATIDKRDFGEFGFTLSTLWLRDFLAGNIMAALAISGILTFFVFAGFARVSLNHEAIFTGKMAAHFLKMLLLMLAVSVWEEAYFRSYLIPNIREGFRFGFINGKHAAWFAVLVSSVIFGISHAGNPNSTVVSSLNIALAGIILAYPFIKTKSIAISVGMHLSWNYFQGIVFGLPVSGLIMESSLVITQITGPEYITGGQFGPEGGAAGLIGLLLLAATCRLYLAFFYKKV